MTMPEVLSRFMKCAAPSLGSHSLALHIRRNCMKEGWELRKRVAGMGTDKPKAVASHTSAPQAPTKSAKRNEI